MPTKPHFFNLSLDELVDVFSQWGMPRFRAKQVCRWVYQHHTIDPAAMSNLSKADRRIITERLDFAQGDIIGTQRATDGVQKLLMNWTDGKGQSECVMIPAEGRKTACISSQVGCAVGCKFCASGLGGVDADLTAGQIVEQVWRLGTREQVGRISHVVFMGMGEPLANFAEVTRAVRTIMADWALGVSARRITISTVGLPAQMRRLAELDLPITLAISLHAPNDKLRRELIPWADYVTIAQLLDTGRYYFQRTGREITLEYILLRGVNDQTVHAHELATIAKTLRSNVNLIRYNEVRDLPFNRPATDDVLAFQNVLRAAGVNTHIRASRGRDIAAACGQLRHEHARS
jgi:23S rRNA (adenine2503-C2)-methyltransferase